VVRQLLQPDEWILPCLPIICITDGTPHHGIGVVTKPDGIRGFSVILRFVTEGKREHRMAVLMPGMDKCGDSIFEKISEDQRAQKRLDVGFSLLPPYPNALSRSDSIQFPYYVWKKYGPQQT
jgi:hypothetical protein